jgi:molybdenum cofactor sulfurtransferase
MISSISPSHAMFRKVEYPQLKDGVYADWAGAALIPRAMLAAQQDLLMNHVLGNPHSRHSPSALSTDLVEQARARILQELGADDVPNDEYDVIFTPNATGAILLLNNIEWCGGSLLMLADNHNSVNGLREKGIWIRSGCLYNPGCNEAIFGYSTARQMAVCSDEQHRA